jgi:AcrR family transcriptional regulator
MAATRKDALRSREALIDAFLELIAERGEDVPMYEIAKRAGVGQGTLYRHFPTRTDLAAAVFERINDQMAEVAAHDPDDPDLLRELLTIVAGHQARMHSLSVSIWSGASVEDEAVAHLATRTIALFEEPLRVAQRDGRIRPEVTTRDLITITAMVEGVLMGVADPADRDAAVARTLGIAWRGIGADG